MTKMKSRTITKVKEGDVISMPSRDKFIMTGPIFGTGRKNVSIKIWEVDRVFPYCISCTSQEGLKKCFSLGDLVMNGYEPSFK